MPAPERGQRQPRERQDQPPSQPPQHRRGPADAHAVRRRPAQPHARDGDDQRAGSGPAGPTGSVMSSSAEVRAPMSVTAPAGRRRTTTVARTRRRPRQEQPQQRPPPAPSPRPHRQEERLRDVVRRGARRWLPPHPGGGAAPRRRPTRAGPAGYGADPGRHAAPALGRRAGAGTQATRAHGSACGADAGGRVPGAYGLRSPTAPGRRVGGGPRRPRRRGRPVIRGTAPGRRPSSLAPPPAGRGCAPGRAARSTRTAAGRPCAR